MWFMLKNYYGLLHTNPLSYIHYSRRRSEHWNLYELKTCAACRQQKTLGQCGHVFVRIGTQWEGKRFFDHTSKRLLNGRIHLVDTNHFYADLYFIDETRFSVSFSLSAQASPWFHKSFVWRTTIFWWQAIFFILLLKTDTLENYSCPTVEKRR